MFLVVFFVALAAAQLPAFPEAYGAGAYTSGGRGGEVVHVTNLADSGAGSLRAALGGSNRIIVFDVAGVIQVQSRLTMGDARDVTIAGQTAPEGGITIQGMGNFVTMMLYNCDNVVVRHLRVRGGDAVESDALQVYNGRNIILDHLSVSYGTDEAFSVTGSGTGLLTVENVTVQRTLFSRSKTGVILGGSSHLIKSISFHHNLFHDITHRFPNAAGITGSRFDVINNVAHNWRNRLMASFAQAASNHINNYVQNGGLGQFVHYNKLQPGVGAPMSIYTAGSIIAPSTAANAVSDPASDNRVLWQEYTQGTTPVATTFFRDTPHPFLGRPVPIQSAVDAFNDVRVDVGANARLDADGSFIPNMDTLDTAALADVASNNGRSYSGTNIQKTVPPITGGTKHADTNNDGIPDQWVIARGLGVNDDLSQHVWPSGYVGIEEYINGIPMSGTAPTTSNSMPTVQGATLSPTTAVPTSSPVGPSSAGATLVVSSLLFFCVFAA